MSGLLGSLSAAARALEAQRFGLEVAGQNIANANTAGYTRREAHFASVPGVTPLSPGNGVEITGVRAARDQRLDLRLQQERPAEQREAALAEALAVVETAIGDPGTSLDASMTEFFDSVGRLASDPTSSVARQEVTLQASDLASDFRDMASRLELAQRDADAGVRAGIDQVNSLVQRIASLNNSLSKVPPKGSESLHLQDELGLAMKDLTGLLDVDTITRPDGGLDVSYGNGRPLVIGANAYPMNMVSNGPQGLAEITPPGNTTDLITDEITGGRLGGLLHARNVSIPGYMRQLDKLAHAVVTQVNTVHAAGYDLNGVTGRNLFVPLATDAGAASAMAVDPDTFADPTRVAAAQSTAGGDNRNAKALADLRNTRGMEGGTQTFTDAWSQMVYRVGADSRAAKDEQRSRAEIVRQVELLREQVSGVSLDEEAMMLMKFQRAYEANARYFQAVDSALNTLIQSIGR